MSKNERKWTPLTPGALLRISEEMQRMSDEMRHASRLLETAAVTAEFDLTDVERKPAGEDGGDRGG